MGLNKLGLVLTFVGFMFLDGLLLCKAQNSYYDFYIKEKNFTRLCETKSILTVNGSFPGPTLHVHKGDTIYVNVHNQGLYGLTMHWHGVKQPRNPWSDGPENVTQCPIKPGTNFTYEVIFSTEEGTLWWHAHSDWTRATVHGALVVYPAVNTSYPFPKPYAEQTIIIASWFKGDIKELIDVSLETGADPNVSDAFTINGEPGDLYKCSNATTFRLLVDYGKTYLLRIINAVMNEEHFLGIAKHNLTVVAQDAAYLKPLTTSYIMIAPGQTMDILVTANQALSHYYLASTPFVDGDVAYNNSTTTAVLQYTGNYTTPSNPFRPTLPSANDSTAALDFVRLLRALASTEHPISVPTNITKQFFIAVSINEVICPANATCDGPDGNKLSASLNNISFVFPSTDILQAYYRGINGIFNATFPVRPSYIYNYTGDVKGNTMYPTQDTRVRFLKYGEQVEIIFQGTNIIAPENHPMHLHGFSFYLVGTGTGNFNATTAPNTYNLVDPPEINTVPLPKNGWTTVRFVADNPGVWFMHCHLERHSSWGMNTVFIVLNGNTSATKMIPEPAGMPICS